jgi:hypothetical protein
MLHGIAIYPRCASKKAVRLRSEDIKNPTLRKMAQNTPMHFIEMK